MTWVLKLATFYDGSAPNPYYLGAASRAAQDTALRRSPMDAIQFATEQPRGVPAAPCQATARPPAR